MGMGMCVRARSGTLTGRVPLPMFCPWYPVLIPNSDVSARPPDAFFVGFICLGTGVYMLDDAVRRVFLQSSIPPNLLRDTS